VINKAKELYYFLIPTLIALLIGGFFIVSQPKADIHIYINSHHEPLADAFFTFMTYLGEGWMFLMAIPLLFIANGRAGIHMAIAALFTLLFTGIFKQVLFEGEPRPVEFFKNIYDLYLVPGVNMHSWNSFPSGHTTAAFAVWLTMAAYLHKKWLIFICFLVAFLVGYSRMYLSQHFLIDVEFGAIFGVVASSLGYYFSSLFPTGALDKNLLKKSS